MECMRGKGFYRMMERRSSEMRSALYLLWKRGEWCGKILITRSNHKREESDMSESNDRINFVSKNASDTAALVWSVADDLVGAYKPYEYGLVILPMTVIKRFHDCLTPTHQAVLDTYR